MKYKDCYINLLNIVSVLSLFVILLTSCSTNVCKEPEGKILQVYTTANEIARTFLVDHGVFDETVTLTICDKENHQLLEEIVLRVEDEVPTVDSLIGTNIYIHYSSTRPTKMLEFGSVVLGEALLHREKLKYNYIFSNIKN